MFDFKKAVIAQKVLKERVVIKPLGISVNYIAGCDLTFLNPFKTPTTGIAAFTLFKYPELELVDKVWVSGDVKVPYVPGFLAFREVPLLIKAYKKLSVEPDVVIVDGHGITHPRGFGVASHFGVVTGKTAIGCAKKPLYGSFSPPDNKKGQYSFIFDDKGEKVGAVLRTRKNVKPVYISPGHFIDIEDCIEIIFRCLTSYRLPEPTRIAHNFLKEIRKQLIERQGTKK